MLTHKLVTDVVERALTEDCPWGDATVAVSIPAHLEFQANLVAREPGFFAGGAVLVETFQQVDPRIVITNLVTDGTAFSAGDVLASLSGPAAGILTGERVALNFVQRLSGIAT
ncbi:MAG: nicotinate-nucleotide diphosphorylase (carboxylating), partial [Yaniella sp.]|nr:nicotinate-nucleotide diphosphorylase (carboxylating) [Yaniella sp.]